jgi:hypothetical protein
MTFYTNTFLRHNHILIYDPCIISSQNFHNLQTHFTMNSSFQFFSKFFAIKIEVYDMWGNINHVPNFSPLFILIGLSHEMEMACMWCRWIEHN